MAEIKEVMNKSANWLLEKQDKHTGGWADRAGGLASILNTAEAIIAILDGGVTVAGDKRIQQGVQFLLQCQCTKGPDRGTWPRVHSVEHGKPIQIPDMVRTSFAIQALIKAGTGVKEKPVVDAVEWLLTIRNKDNGWGYRQGNPSVLMPTCFALMALIEAYKAGLNKHKQHITDRLKFLVDKYSNTRGSFRDPGPFEAVHTIYATLVLQAARSCELSLYTDKENVAIGWLLEHPDKARQLVEERVTIDAKGRLDYDFLFMTDSLLIRVLMGSLREEHQNSTLARDTMISLREKKDEGGGFYGSRVFSWSTAKVLSALSIASSQFREFPKRPPEYTGVKVGNFVLIFAILLLASVVYLTIKNSFQLQQAAVFIFLMLASLLAYGKIGEKTFKELVKGVTNLWGGK